MMFFKRGGSLLGRMMKHGMNTSWRCHSNSQLNSVLKKLKLTRNQSVINADRADGTLEVLKPNYKSLDEIHIRSRQPHVLYVRSELVLQRLGYLKPMGLQRRQQRKLLEKSPPLLLLVHDYKSDEVNYLRGVIRVEDNSSGEGFVHFCHPYPSQILMRVFDLKSRVSLIQEELGMATETVLKYLLNMPAVLLHGTENVSAKFQTIHKYALPKGYDLDKHTAAILPPVYKTHLNTDPRLQRQQDNRDELQDSFQLFTEVLDYSYPQHHGSGRPEDLTSFLICAERTELRPRYNKVM